MARYRILSWRGVPAQLKVYPDEGGRPRSVQLADWYGQEIDRIAMREGIVGTDQYLKLWQWSGDLERPGTPDEVVAELTAEIDARWRLNGDRAEGGEA
jgi:hypothetical protein